MTEAHWPTGIRWGLTAVLIFGVYTETGIWTAISFALVFLALEILVWLGMMALE